MSVTSGPTFALALLIRSRAELTAWFRFTIVPLSDSSVALSSGEPVRVLIELAASVIETTNGLEIDFLELVQRVRQPFLQLAEVGLNGRDLAIRPARLQRQIHRRARMKIEVDIQKPGQETFGGELGSHSPLGPVLEAGGFERFSRCSPRQQLRSVDIDDDWQPKTLDTRAYPSLRGQNPEFDRRDRADLHSPYFDRRSDLETVEVALEHADEAHRLGEHPPGADHYKATTRIAKLATTNAPITAGLTRLPMTAY